MNTYIERLMNKSREIDKQFESPPLPPPTEHKKSVEERWTIYWFTIPVKYSKKIAWGFPNKQEAKIFIDKHLVKKDTNDTEIPKYLTDNTFYINENGHKEVNYTLTNTGERYRIKYDVILESREEVNLYYNDPEITTVGNNWEKAYERWID